MPSPPPASDPCEEPREGSAEFGLAALLAPIPEEALGFDPAKVPDHVVTTLPLAKLEAQVGSGRVTVPLSLVIEGCAERFQPAFARADQSYTVQVPFQDVLRQLPKQSPEDSPAPPTPSAEAGPAASRFAFDTPFSRQAEEDAKSNPFVSSPAKSAVPAAPEPPAPPEPPFPRSPFGSPVASTSSEPVPQAPKPQASPATPDETTAEIHQPPGLPSPFGAPGKEAPPTVDAGIEQPGELGKRGFDPFVKPEEKPVQDRQAGQPAPSGPVLPPLGKGAGFPQFSPLDAPPSQRPSGPSAPAFSGFPAADKPASPEPEAPKPEALTFAAAKPLGPMPGIGTGFRLTAPPPAPPTGGLSSDDLLEDLDDLETLPAPSLTGAAPALPPLASPPEETEDLSFGYADDAPGQLALRALFGTADPISRQRAVSLSAGLPGIAACVFLDGSEEGALTAGDLDERSGDALRHAPELYANVRGLAKMMGVGEDATTFTIRTGHGILSFFTEGKTCLGVVHATGGFQPGVREKLTLISRELAAMTEAEQPA